MRLLLDSCTFLWWVKDDPALRRRARAAIADADNECFLSHASIWEMAIKASLGKLKLPSTVERFVVEHCEANSFHVLSITLAHIASVEGFRSITVIRSTDCSWPRHGTRL